MHRLDIQRFQIGVLGKRSKRDYGSFYIAVSAASTIPHCSVSRAGDLVKAVEASVPDQFERMRRWRTTTTTTTTTALFCVLLLAPWSRGSLADSNGTTESLLGKGLEFVEDVVGLGEEYPAGQPTNSSNLTQPTTTTTRSTTVTITTTTTVVQTPLTTTTTTPSTTPTTTTRKPRIWPQINCATGLCLSASSNSTPRWMFVNKK